MPKYQFHRLPAAGGDARPTETVLYNDVAAMRRAIGPDFPDGCEVWQGQRFIGRFHGAAQVEPSAEPEPEMAVRPVAVRA